MEEKIKIYVPESVNNILLKDMELFEILKKDGNLNRNEFYNTLIVNYYEQFQKRNNQILDKVRQSIKENIKCSENDTNLTAAAIVQYFNVINTQLEINHLSEVSLSLKPTKSSSDVISFIQNQLLGSMTLSGYFRNMFASYALMPQDKREKIIFKDNFEKIEEALKTDRNIYFTTVKSSNPHIASPYQIASAKEELFNYLICEYKGNPFSFRMSRIRKAIVLNDPASFKDKNIEIFEKMIKQGPQYSYTLKQDEKEIKVYMTDRGKQMYKDIYLHRPQYTRIEGDFYYFNCSKGQAVQYFTKLGRNAIVVEPVSVAGDINKFYAMADKAYKRYFKQHSYPENDEE